jgi:hypothetical protein
MVTAPFTKTFATITQDFTAAAQATSETPLDFRVGSVWLALAEAVGGNVDWLQKLYLFALTTERLATSQGPWVDTWTADYMPPFPGTSSPRLPATSALGTVQFSRSTPQNQAIIPVGSVVATFDAQETFQVVADNTNTSYSATITPGGGYIIPAGVPSVNVPVSGLNPGSDGNVQANTITLIQSSLIGVDNVTNLGPITSAQDPETDSQLKARFVQYIASLSQGTDQALQYAITSLKQGLQAVVHDNVDTDGATDYGNVIIYVDDGSGNPPSTTVASALTAVQNVHAAGVRISVLGATMLPVSVSMTIITGAGYYHPTVVAAVGNAIETYIDNLGLEQPLPYSEVIHVAYSASQGVTNVLNTTVNGATSDITPGMGQTCKVTSLSIQ